MGNKAKICFAIKSMIQKQKPLTTTVTQSTRNNTENKTLCKCGLFFRFFHIVNVMRVCLIRLSRYKWQGTIL